LQVHVTFDSRRRQIKAHRIVFALTHGHWPRDQVDHMHGVEAGNGVGNLREATNGQNQHNQRTRQDNTSGYPNVSWHKQTGKWQTQIRVAGSKHYLGLFDDPREAYAAVCDAKAKLHPFQPVQRDMTEEQAEAEAYAWFQRRAWREIV
jgi:hypothetical protein